MCFVGNDLSSVTVIDFGNAIQHVHKEIALYYDDFELQTPLYRAPEVMFGMPFGKEIDMWSLGCILAELYLSKPLFMGNSKRDIMQQITSLLGPFPGRTFQRGKFYSSYRRFTDTVEQPDATELLLRHLGCRDYLLADFLAGLLRYNPDERMTPFEAAKHSFLAPEFPFGYLLPPSSGDGDASYCAVYLTDAKYKHRPVVAPDIRRSQPSTYDILSLGTTLKEEEDDESPTQAGDTPNKHGRVAKVVPVQREPSLDTVQRCAGEVTRQQNSARNRSSIDAIQRGFTHIQRDQKKNVQQNVSPILTEESTIRDKTTVQRDQKEQKYQGEITQPSERQRQREGYQKHSSVINRRGITKKESSAVHRSRDANDHHESARLIGNSPNDRCNQVLREKVGTKPGRVETIPGSPSLLRVRKDGEVTIRMRRDKSVSCHSAGERKQGERSPLHTSSVKEEQWSLTEGNKLRFIKDKNRPVGEETHQESDNQSEISDGESDQFQLTMEDDTLTREDELPPLKRYHRGREVTPNGHIVQATSRNADSDRKCNHPNIHKNRRLSRPGSVSTDMNETFVIESDSSSSGRSHLQNKTQRQHLNHQKYEIIRPRPGWFPRKGDSDTYPDSKSEEHFSVRCNMYQKPTAVSVLNETQDFLNRDAEHVIGKSDKSLLNKYVDCLPELNTDSQDWRRDHMKQSKRQDIHGNIKRKGTFCEMSPGYIKKKSLHIPQSPSSLSQETESDIPSSYKQCHQRSPRHPAQNPRQLASLMNAIREEQDRAEHDLSEKESDRQFKFEVDKRTPRDEKKSSSIEMRFSENCLSTSKMYESVSEDDFHSFDEEKRDAIRTETDQNSGYASSDSASEACVRPLKGFPTYNNSEKRQDYYEHNTNRNPKFPSHLSSNANGKEEKSFKTEGFSGCRVEHWEKTHLYESSPARVSASRQNSAFEEDNTDVIYRPIIQKSANAQNFSSELPAVSAEEIKHSKTQVTCESSSRRRGGTHTDDMYDCQHNRASHRACNNVLEKKERKEMIKYGKRDQNLSKMDGETPGSKKQYRKTFNLRYKGTPDKLSDGDILRNECRITASQNDISNNGVETDSETRYSMSASTESAIVTRANNKAEVAIPATDSTATHSHTSSRTQESELLEPDSCKQVLHSKVTVKKVAKKKLNFTQALKPRKTNKSKIKVLSKSRLTPVTTQHSNEQVKKLRTNGKGEDPYVFLITPEKNISNQPEGNTIEVSSGGKKLKQKFSKLVSDTRRKGRNKCSQMDTEDNSSQDLDKKPNIHRKKGSLDKKEPRKYRTKGSLVEKEPCQSKREQTQGIKTTRSKEKQKEEISEEKLLQLSVNKSCTESKNAIFFNSNCQATEMSIMNGEMQQPVNGEEKKGQKQKRKAASLLRTDMKRQKQSDNLDPDCISSVDLGRSLNRNDIGMQNSSNRYTVRGRNDTDGEFGESDGDCEGTGRSGYGAVEHYIHNEITQSENYRTGRTKTGDYNSQSKDSEESEETESSQSSVSQSRVYQSGQSESQNVAKSSNHLYQPGQSESQNVAKSSNHLYQPGQSESQNVAKSSNHLYLSGQSESQNVAKSSIHRHKSPRKCHPAGHQHTTSVGVNDGGKHLTKTTNLVAIGKSRRTTHTQDRTLVNKGAHNKNYSPHKFKSANYSKEDTIQLHHLGQLDEVYRQAAETGTVFQRGDIHQLNEMSSDCSLEEGACEEGAEFDSSDSEEVMLV
ncbi:Dual specificity tyrosine-phosphorylation-regulated kinase 2 [Mizuhopecten yessoensis]|uniref:Dual specificity tyrosine-phosphorylation-regulated kinase 2 n=1 Tax=Mizuhopecten yessoensis TaxID=6573 RepID=A0A210PP48_MIZYE|nr:Dual specificity tyrosine-phosphorylation-regulated kinase 2 [Mizuhopecten yessoensis]